jgi:hypothetical protein
MRLQLYAQPEDCMLTSALYCPGSGHGASGYAVWTLTILTETQPIRYQLKIAQGSKYYKEMSDFGKKFRISAHE